jgi:hypothetical protein
MTNLSDGWSTDGKGLTFKGKSKEKALIHDPVNSPAHYKRDEVECIDAMRQITSEEGFEEYCHLNAFKYIWRCKNKQNKKQDVQKAIWYLRMMIGDDPREQEE